MYIIPMLEISPHGGNRVLVQIANFLVSRGEKVRIITSKFDSTSDNFQLSEKVEVVEFFGFIKYRPARWFLFLLIFPFFSKCENIIANHFLTSFSAYLSSLAFGSKYYYLVQDIEFEFYKGNRRFDWFLKFLCLKSYKTGGVISANDYLTGRLSKYCSIDYEFKLGIQAPCAVSQGHKAYDVVYFARKEKHKGLDRFLQILKDNEQLNFLCISQDSELLEKLQIWDNVTTNRPKDDISLAKELIKAKVLLLTSYHEGFSLPPLEAMGYGIPFIYFGCGGPSVYADDNNSIEIFSVNDFLNAYNRIFADYSNYKKGAFSTAADFSIEVSLERFHRFMTKH